MMLDLGQPMHAYDLDKIEGPIVVKFPDAPGTKEVMANFSGNLRR